MPVTLWGIRVLTQGSSSRQLSKLWYLKWVEARYWKPLIVYTRFTIFSQTRVCPRKWYPVDLFAQVWWQSNTRRAKFKIAESRPLMNGYRNWYARKLNGYDKIKFNFVCFRFLIQLTVEQRLTTRQVDPTKISQVKHLTFKRVWWIYQRFYEWMNEWKSLFS